MSVSTMRRNRGPYDRFRSSVRLRRRQRRYRNDRIGYANSYGHSDAEQPNRQRWRGTGAI